VSRITAEPGPAKTLRITATTMALDFSVTFFGDPVIKVNGEAIRDSGTRSSKRDRRERARNSDSGQSFSTSEAESISPSAQAHHALATPPGSKQPSLATSSSLPTSDPKRRCVGSPSPSTPVTITTTTVSSPACMTDGSEDDLVAVNKKHCNPPTQDISKGLACHFHARDPRDTPMAGQRSMIQSAQLVSTSKKTISVRTTVRSAERLLSRVRSNGNTWWRRRVSLFRLSWWRAFIPTALLPLGSGSRPKGRESRNSGGRYGKFCFETGRAVRRIVGLPR